MFWSGNYIVVRELNFLLKEENVSLSQVLEADDILQECKADNKALIQFLTKPDVLAELITLITEEPPKNVELTSQYRHASIACEVLTSHLSMLSDRLSLDTVQMHRLCDFISKDPPLNPLLASYFSKTVEMLLERSPKQDWYLYHIVCLRVLDFFKSRRDFLPNLLRHLATSAIADTFKYFVRLDDLFNKIVMEWLEEHQFLECLIQIVCGSHVSEPVPAPLAREPPSEPAPPVATTASDVAADSADTAAPAKVANSAENANSAAPEPGAGESGRSEAFVNHKDTKDDEKKDPNAAKESRSEAPACAERPADEPPPAPAPSAAGAEAASGAEVRAARMQAVASANAAGLLCDLILNGCAGEGSTTRPRTSWLLLSRLQSEETVRLLLQCMFTSPLPARRHAVVNGCQVLLALLSQDPILASECETERTSVELAVAPHLPLLHHALLHDPEQYAHHEEPECEEGCGERARARRVGAARVHVAALLAQLAVSEVQEVPTTMLTLGTPGALVDMFFAYPDNNFLHAQVYLLVKNAFNNRVYRTQYANHLILECDLLNRLMDVFEENEEKKCGTAARSGYMGHVVLALARAARALDAERGELAHRLTLPDALERRWRGFHDATLQPLLHQHDTPLGGYYPPENIYEEENIADTLEGGYEFNDMMTVGLQDINEEMNEEEVNELGVGSGVGEAGEMADGLDDDPEKLENAKRNFMELVGQRRFDDDDMWDDTETILETFDEPAAEKFSRMQQVLENASPWDTANEESSSAGEGWAQFGGDVFGSPADPFAAPSEPPPAPPGAPGPPSLPGQAEAHSATYKEKFDDSQEFSPFWSCNKDRDVAGDSSSHDLDQHTLNSRLEQNLSSQPLHDATAELASNLLTAMSSMTPEVIANIVNANMISPMDLHEEEKDRQAEQKETDKKDNSES